jgi:hypothetical protein
MRRRLLRFISKNVDVPARDVYSSELEAVDGVKAGTNLLAT